MEICEAFKGRRGFSNIPTGERQVNNQGTSEELHLGSCHFVWGWGCLCLRGSEFLGVFYGEPVFVLVQEEEQFFFLGGEVGGPYFLVGKGGRLFGVCKGAQIL